MRILWILWIAGLVLGRLNEPEDGKRYLAAWLNTASNSSDAGSGDTPAKFNQRMGLSVSAVHYGQNLPLSTVTMFPQYQVTALNADVMVMLSVYASKDPWNVTDDQLNALAMQCSQLNKDGFKVVLRLLPEMNGNWFAYGMRPLKFVTLWTTVRKLLGTAGASQTAMLWGVSPGDGYPHSFVRPADMPDEEFNKLDTNNDGTVDSHDDPYSPFYPGDELVDWVGMSVYHYAGSAYPWDYNSIPSSGKFVRVMNYGGFYDQYAASKNIPFAVSESGAAWHPSNLPDPDNPGPLPSELQIKQAWWRQAVTNRTFFAQFPKLKLFSLFEVAKFEETQRDLVTPDLRDFRVSTNETIRNAFLQDFQHDLFIQPTVTRHGNANPADPGPNTGISGYGGCIDHRDRCTNTSNARVTIPSFVLLVIHLLLSATIECYY